MYDKKRVIAIVLAAGKGSRIGFDKMLYKLDKDTVLDKSIQAFEKNNLIDEIIVTAGENFSEVTQISERYSKVTQVVLGGDTRANSVKNALEKVCDDSIVAIHDGARPFVSDDIITQTILAMQDYKGAIPCVVTKDTIKVAKDGEVEYTPNRSNLYITQTPQVFDTNTYKQLLENNTDPLVTDDAQLFEKAGIKVKITNGAYFNYKITTIEDIRKEKTMRIGHGYDVHKLVENRKLILGGVDIPYEKGLLGHSDADVLLHAIMDSMLGALALGDIGKHFPDTDEKYSGADSIKLLEFVSQLIKDKGYQVGNIDATVIAQSPKLAPYIPTMISNIAKAIGTDNDRISVKATTEEKLGFTGRKEGIATHCVCLLTKI